MSKLLNLLALTTLAVFATSFGASPVAAIQVERNLHGSTSNFARGHDSIAKRKRSSSNTNKKCKPRASSSAAPPPKQTPKTQQANTNTNNNQNNNQASSGGASGSVPAHNGKLGYAWSNGPNDLAQYMPKGGKNIPLYNWSEKGPSNAKQLGFDFWPMLWGYKNLDAFKSTVKAGSANVVLGPNEPEIDNASGLSSGMSPDDAVKLYWEALHPLAEQGVAILTPAVTSGDKGFEWMKEFMGKCQGCKFAAQALHWYDISHQAAIDHFKKHHDQFKMDIHCTEMAFNNFNNGAQLSKDQVFSEVSAFNSWATSSDASFLKTVMYFGFQQDMVNVSPLLKLMNADNSPNDLGRMIMQQLA